MDDLWKKSEVTKLRKKLNDVLVQVFPVADVETYTNEQNMPVWCRAFTHATSSPGFNNEMLEYLGDTMLKFVFPKLAMVKSPGLSFSQYSELNAYYMGKYYHEKLVRERLEIEGYVKVSSGVVTFGVAGDLFEAFFGALAEVSDNVVPGLAAMNCFFMLRWIFATRDLDIEKSYGSEKTRVSQVTKRMGAGEPKPVNTYIEGEGFGTKLVWNRHMMEAINNILQANGKRPYNFRKQLDDDGNYVLAEVRGQSSKHGAETKAYEIALRKIFGHDGLGITRDQVRFAKAYQDVTTLGLSNEDLKSYWRKVQSLGYDFLEFEIHSKTSTQNSGTLIQLIGVKDGQRRKIFGNEFVASYNKVQETDSDRADKEELRRVVRLNLIDQFMKNN